MAALAANDNLNKASRELQASIKALVTQLVRKNAPNKAAMNNAMANFQTKTTAYKGLAKNAGKNLTENQAKANLEAVRAAEMARSTVNNVNVPNSTKIKKLSLLARAVAAARAALKRSKFNDNKYANLKSMSTSARGVWNAAAYVAALPKSNKNKQELVARHYQIGLGKFDRHNSKNVNAFWNRVRDVAMAERVKHFKDRIPKTANGAYNVDKYVTNTANTTNNRTIGYSSAVIGRKYPNANLRKFWANVNAELKIRGKPAGPAPQSLANKARAAFTRAPQLLANKARAAFTRAPQSLANKARAAFTRAPVNYNKIIASYNSKAINNYQRYNAASRMAREYSNASKFKKNLTRAGIKLTAFGRGGAAGQYESRQKFLTDMAAFYKKQVNILAAGEKIEVAARVSDIDNKLLAAQKAVPAAVTKAAQAAANARAAYNKAAQAAANAQKAYNKVKGPPGENEDAKAFAARKRAAASLAAKTNAAKAVADANKILKNAELAGGEEYQRAMAALENARAAAAQATFGNIGSSIADLEKAVRNADNRLESAKNAKIKALKLKREATNPVNIERTTKNVAQANEHIALTSAERAATILALTRAKSANEKIKSATVRAAAVARGEVKIKFVNKVYKSVLNAQKAKNNAQKAYNTARGTPEEADAKKALAAANKILKNAEIAHKNAEIAQKFANDSAATRRPLAPLPTGPDWRKGRFMLKSNKKLVNAVQPVKGPGQESFFYQLPNGTWKTLEKNAKGMMNYGKTNTRSFKLVNKGFEPTDLQKEANAYIRSVYKKSGLRESYSSKPLAELAEIVNVKPSADLLRRLNVLMAAVNTYEKASNKPREGNAPARLERTRLIATSVAAKFKQNKLKNIKNIENVKKAIRVLQASPFNVSTPEKVGIIKSNLAQLQKRMNNSSKSLKLAANNTEKSRIDANTRQVMAAIEALRTAVDGRVSAKNIENVKNGIAEKTRILQTLINNKTRAENVASKVNKNRTDYLTVQTYDNMLTEAYANYTQVVNNWMNKLPNINRRQINVAKKAINSAVETRLAKIQGIKSSMMKDMIISKLVGENNLRKLENMLPAAGKSLGQMPNGPNKNAAAAAVNAANKRVKKAAAEAEITRIINELNGKIPPPGTAVNVGKHTNLVEKLTKAKQNILAAAGTTGANKKNQELSRFGARIKTFGNAISRADLLAAVKSEINKLTIAPANNKPLRDMLAEIGRVESEISAITKLKNDGKFTNADLENKLQPKIAGLAALKTAAQAKAQEEYTRLKAELNAKLKQHENVLNNPTKSTRVAEGAVYTAGTNVRSHARRLTNIKQAGVAVNSEPFKKRLETLEAKLTNFNKFRITGARGNSINWTEQAKKYLNANNYSQTKENKNRQYKKGLFGWKNKDLTKFWTAVKAEKTSRKKTGRTGGAVENNAAGGAVLAAAPSAAGGAVLAAAPSAAGGAVLAAAAPSAAGGAVLAAPVVTRGAALAAAAGPAVPDERPRPATWTINAKYNKAYAKNTNNASKLYIRNGTNYKQINNRVTGAYDNQRTYTWNGTNFV